MKTILVATDLSARSDRAVLRAVVLAKDLNAKLIITHIIDDEMPRGILGNAKKIAEEEINLCIKGKVKDVKYEIRIITGNPHVDLLKMANKKEIDIIVLGIHRHTKSNQPVIGKVIERMIKGTQKPVLIAKERPELKYKNILAALDFNIHSKKSLKLSLELFPKSTFHVMHSYQMPFLGIVGNDKVLEQQTIDISEEELEETIKNVTRSTGKSAGSYKIKKIIKKGYILDTIFEEITYLNPELLVLGTHGRTGLAGALIPSTTEAVLVNPPCDTLVIM